MDLDVLSDEVRKLGVVEETACAVLPENPRLGVSVSLKNRAYRGIGKIILTGYKASDP